MVHRAQRGMGLSFNAVTENTQVFHSSSEVHSFRSNIERQKKKKAHISPSAQQSGGNGLLVLLVNVLSQ